MSVIWRNHKGLHPLARAAQVNSQSLRDMPWGLAPASNTASLLAFPNPPHYASNEGGILLLFQGPTPKQGRPFLEPTKDLP